MVRLAEALCRIIDTENPIFVGREYNLCLSAIGITRMRRQSMRAMKSALEHAIQQGRIAKLGELGAGGLIDSIVRIVGRLGTGLHERGLRRFRKIPPSKVGLMASRLSHDRTFESGFDDHIPAVLEAFDVQGLTVRGRLLVVR